MKNIVLCEKWQYNQYATVLCTLLPRICASIDTLTPPCVKQMDRWLSVCLACFCGGTWSSGASQVAQSAPCLPYPASLEAVRGVGISEAYLDMGPLGSTQETPGRATDHFTVLAHTGCIVLRSSQWRHAHRDVFCRETWYIPLRLRCTEHPGAFPRAHIHVHIHMAKTIQ